MPRFASRSIRGGATRAPRYLGRSFADPDVPRPLLLPTRYFVAIFRCCVVIPIPPPASYRFLDARRLALRWTWDNLGQPADGSCRFTGRFWSRGFRDVFAPNICRFGKLLPIESKLLHFSCFIGNFSSQRRKLAWRRGLSRKSGTNLRSTDVQAGGQLHPPARLDCRDRCVPEIGRANGARNTFR
jgi:hypothetical protein